MDTSLLHSDGDLAAAATHSVVVDGDNEVIELVAPSNSNKHGDRNRQRNYSSGAAAAIDGNHLTAAVIKQHVPAPSHDAAVAAILARSSVDEGRTGQLQPSERIRRVSSFQQQNRLSLRQKRSSFAYSTRPEAEATSRIRLSSITKPIGFGFSNDEQPQQIRRSSRLSITIPVKRRTSSFARENGLPGLIAAGSLLSAPVSLVNPVDERLRQSSITTDGEGGVMHFVDSNPVVNARRTDRTISRKTHRGEYDAIVELCKMLASASGRKVPRNFKSRLPDTFAVVTREPYEVYASSSIANQPQPAALSSVYVVRTGYVEVISNEDQPSTVSGAEAPDINSFDNDDDVILVDRYSRSEYFGELSLLFGNEVNYCVTFRAAAAAAADRQSSAASTAEAASNNSSSSSFFTQCVEIPHVVFAEALQCNADKLSTTMRPAVGVYGWLQQRAIFASVISYGQPDVFTWRLHKQAVTLALSSLPWFSMLPAEALRELVTTYAARQSAISGTGALLTLYQNGDEILRHDDAEEFVVVIKGGVSLQLTMPAPSGSTVNSARIATPLYPLVFGESTALLTHHYHHKQDSSQQNDFQQPHYLRKTDALLHSKDQQPVQLQAYNYAYCIILHRSVLDETALESSQFHRALHDRKHAWHRLDAARDPVAIQRHGLILHQVEVIVHILLHAMHSWCCVLAERSLCLAQAWSTTLPDQLYEYILADCIVPQTVDENTLVIPDKKQLKSATVLVLDGQLELLKKKNKSVKLYNAGSLFWKEDRHLNGKKLLAKQTSLYIEFDSERLHGVVQEASMMVQDI